MFEFWTNFSNGLFEYSMDAFSNVEPWTYPLIFIGIIGYVYSATHSIITAIVAIIITFGLYGTVTNVFENVPDVSIMFSLISLIGISSLIFTLFMKKVVH